MNIRLILTGLVASAALYAVPGTACAQIFVTDFGRGVNGAGTIGEYNATTGASVNPALISGLNGPLGIAVSGGNLFVVNFNTGTIGEYTTSGATVNPALVSGLGGPVAIAASGGNLFVTNTFTNTIGKYTTSGQRVNPALISGLSGPDSIAVSGGNLFVANEGTDTIGQYTTSGAAVNPALIGASFGGGLAASGDKLFVVNGDTIQEYTTSGSLVNPALISGLNIPLPTAIAVSGGDLFVSTVSPTLESTMIGEYTTSGATVNPALVSGLNFPSGIAVVSAPVPDGASTWTLLLLGLAATFGAKPLLRRSA